MIYPRLLLALLLVSSLRPQNPEITSWDDHVDKLNHHWGKWLRKYWGCPAESHHTSECNPNQGIRDDAEFRKAKEHARAVFNLRDK